MKKFLFICCLTFFSVVPALSQHWEIYRNGDSLLYYMNGHGYDSTSVFIKADSMLVAGNDTTFVMNRKVVEVQSNLLHGNIPFLLQRRIIHFNNGNWNLSDTANWVLRPQDTLLSSWTFDAAQNITASITRLYWGQVLGQNDSIKTITLSNGDSILVSKHYGIISIPPALSGTSAYHLAGFNQSAADSIPGFFEIFAFQPGDILEYTSRDYHFSFNSSQTYPFNGNFRDSVISIQFTSSHVIVNLYQWSAISHNLSRVCSEGAVTWNLAANGYRFLDYQANNSLTITPSYGPFRNPILMEFRNDTIFNCKTKRYFDPPLSGNNYSPTLSPNFFPPGSPIPKYTFGEGVGLLNLYYRAYDPFFSSGYNFDSTLVGLKRNNVEYGTLHDVEFFLEEPPTPPSIAGVFPNPAIEYVVVNAETPGVDARVQLYDVRGRLILEEQFITSITIKLADYSSGLYIIRVTQGETSAEYKLVHHAGE
jgi:hypothetical protein